MLMATDRLKTEMRGVWSPFVCVADYELDRGMSCSVRRGDSRVEGAKDGVVGSTMWLMCRLGR